MAKFGLLKSIGPKEWEKCLLPKFLQLFAKECHPTLYMSDSIVTDKQKSTVECLKMVSLATKGDDSRSR